MEFILKTDNNVFPGFRGETNEDYTEISELVIKICHVCTWKDLRGNHSLFWDTWDIHIDTWMMRQRSCFHASGTDRITLVTCKTGKTKVEDLVTDPMGSEKRRKFCT